jgi:hypothetical protein
MSLLSPDETLQLWKELLPEDEAAKESPQLTLRSIHESLEACMEEIDPLLPTLDQKEHRANFLKGLFFRQGKRVNLQEFQELVRWWQVPSPKPAKGDATNYASTVPCTRRLAAYWSIQGRTVIFLGLVFVVIVGLGVDQALKYAVRCLSSGRRASLTKWTARQAVSGRFRARPRVRQVSPAASARLPLTQKQDLQRAHCTAPSSFCFSRLSAISKHGYANRSGSRDGSTATMRETSTFGAPTWPTSSRCGTRARISSAPSAPARYPLTKRKSSA